MCVWSHTCALTSFCPPGSGTSLRTWQARGRCSVTIGAAACWHVQACIKQACPPRRRRGGRSTRPEPALPEAGARLREPQRRPLREECLPVRQAADAGPVRLRRRAHHLEDGQQLPDLRARAGPERSPAVVTPAHCATTPPGHSLAAALSAPAGWLPASAQTCETPEPCHSPARHARRGSGAAGGARLQVAQEQRLAVDQLGDPNPLPQT